MFFRSDITKGLSEYRHTEGALLIDVREKDEYSSGRIPGAVNIPLSVIDRFNLSISRDTLIFLYCLRGSRSRRAMGILKKRGYSNVKSIGGISGYKGKIEK